MQGEGLVNLLGDLGQLTMTSAGRVNYFSVNDSVSLNIMTALDFFFPDDALKVFADDLIASELKGIDISNINYTKPLREFAGQEEADKLLNNQAVRNAYDDFMLICKLTKDPK